MCDCREKYSGSDRPLTEADGRGVYETGVVMVKEGDIRHNDNVRGLPGGSFDIDYLLQQFSFADLQ